MHTHTHTHTHTNTHTHTHIHDTSIIDATNAEAITTAKNICATFSHSQMSALSFPFEVHILERRLFRIFLPALHCGRTCGAHTRVRETRGCVWGERGRERGREREGEREKVRKLRQKVIQSVCVCARAYAGFIVCVCYSCVL